MGKQKKSRRARSVNRAPRPVGGRRTEHAGRLSLPRQPNLHRLVFRDQVELIEGRAYPATATMTVDGKPMQFDLIANMYGIVRGEVSGVSADILAALAFTYLVEQKPDLMSSLGEELPKTPRELVDSFRRLVDDGFFGRDENGGYLNLNHVHATHA